MSSPHRAIIVGRAASVMIDYAAACALCSFDEIIVIGKMGEVFPDRIDHWVSFHADLFDKWAAKRAALGLPSPAQRWGAIYGGRRLSNLPNLRYVKCVGGSSGFMGVQVAEDLECTHIVLAGIPMDAQASHFPEAADAKEVGAEWKEANNYWATWEANAGRLKSKVRSMSGRTRAMFGAPDVEWLAENG